MNNIDCILIPGGGLLDDGSLPPWTTERLEKALKAEGQRHWFALLSGGTVHKPPPLMPGGFPIRESHQAALYLIKSGIDPSRILTEISSYDTIGNAYFSRLLFTEPLGIKNCLIITSEFHMARTKALFEWIYHLPPNPFEYHLKFTSTDNTGLAPDTLAARIRREKNSLSNLENLKQKISDLPALTKWIYSEHGAYNLQRTTKPLSDDELRSY